MTIYRYFIKNYCFLLTFPSFKSFYWRAGHSAFSYLETSVKTTSYCRHRKNEWLGEVYLTQAQSDFRLTENLLRPALGFSVLNLFMYNDTLTFLGINTVKHRTLPTPLSQHLCYLLSIVDSLITWSHQILLELSMIY